MGLDDNSKEAASFSSLKGGMVVTHTCFSEAALFLLVTQAHLVAPLWGGKKKLDSQAGVKGHGDGSGD